MMYQKEILLVDVKAGIIPAVIVSAMLSLNMTAPIGYPFASGLAIVITSG